MFGSKAPIVMQISTVKVNAIIVSKSSRDQKEFVFNYMQNILNTSHLSYCVNYFKEIQQKENSYAIKNVFKD